MKVDETIANHTPQVVHGLRLDFFFLLRTSGRLERFSIVLDRTCIYLLNIFLA